MMKLHKFKITITSINFYEREVVAENEDKAIEIFQDSLNDNDKINESNFDVDDVENVGEAYEDTE